MSKKPAETFFDMEQEKARKGLKKTEKINAPKRDRVNRRGHHVAIVVLGCRPYVKDTVVSPELQARVGKGIELYQRGFGDLLLFTGGHAHSDLPEALVMKSLAPMIPKENILLEMHSRSTIENARYSKRILLQKGIKDILLVTSPYHMGRAVGIFKESFGDQFRIRPIEADFSLPFHRRIWKRFMEWAKRGR